MRYLDTIFLPSDETCLHLFEARGEAEVLAVAERAGIDVDRVVPAKQIEPCGTSSSQGPLNDFSVNEYRCFDSWRLSHEDRSHSNQDARA